MEKEDKIRKIRVIVIEDDPFIAMVYSDQLADVPNIHFELEVFSTVHEGFEALSDGSYDVLLLDLNLPDSKFDQTITQIPSIAGLIPVVVMTSTNDEGLALLAMNKGAQDYLIKDKLDRTLFIRSVLYSIERQQLRNQLQAAKERSDRLLKSILPAAIAEELKAKGSVEARHYDEVTVMFVDFSNFTAVSEQLDPRELVSELHHCFSHFDQIVKGMGLEKIKTIGDSYMCAGSVPLLMENHTMAMVEAALEMMKFVQHRAAHKAKSQEPYWSARIGIHVGPVVAGVVGTHKFTYDIWGDTVNVASRMESHSEIGRINISEAAYTAVNQAETLQFIPRGETDVKGKGSMQMYFVEPCEQYSV